jgi:hypothetical protein
MHAVAKRLVMGADDAMALLDEVRQQPAEEDRHHQFQWKVDADRRGQHRHAEGLALFSQPSRR